MELQQKLADMDPDTPSRVPTSRKITRVSSPIMPIERIVASSPEREAVLQRVSTRKPTAQSSRASTMREAGQKPEVFEEVSSLTSISLEDEPQDELFEVPEEDFEAPIERIRKATTLSQPNQRQKSMALSSIATSSSHSAIEDVVEEPVISRTATRQPTYGASVPQPEPESDFEPPVMRMRQSTLHASRRQSLRSPSPVAKEEVEPVVSQPSTRQPTRRAIVLEPESQIPPETEAEFEAPMLRIRQSTSQASRRQSLRSPSPIMEDIEDPVVSHNPTRQPTRKSTELVASPSDDFEFEAPVLRMRRASTVPPPPTPELESRDQELDSDERDPSPEPILQKVTTRRPTERQISPEPIMRKVTTRRMTERVPSPQPVVRQVTSRRPTESISSPPTVLQRAITRRSTERTQSPEPVISRVSTRRLTGELASQEPLIRRVTTRKPTERVRVVERALTRQATEPLPPPEEIIRRVTTRKRTEPLEEPPAPPSSPSTEAEEQSIPVRIATTYDTDDTADEDTNEDVVRSVPRAAEGPSRTATFSPEIQRQATAPASRQSTLRRSTTRPEEITLPDSVSSYHSSVQEDVESLTQEPAEEEVEDFIPPVERIRRPTTTLEQPTEDELSEPTSDQQQMVPRRQSIRRESLRRVPTTPVSRKPTRLPTQNDVIENVDNIPLQEEPLEPAKPDIRQSARSETSIEPIEPEELVAPARQPTMLSSKPTRVSTEPALELQDEEPSPVPRRSTTRVSRQPTRVATVPFEPPVQRDVQSDSESDRTEQVVEEVPAPVTQRATTGLSRRPTRVATAPFEVPVQRDVEFDPEAEQVSDSSATTPGPDYEPAPISRRASTRVSRQPTRVSTVTFEPPLQRDVQPDLEAEETEEARDEESAPVPRRATTRVSRQPTRVPTALFEPPVQRDVQPDRETSKTNDTAFGPDSAHSSVLDEPLAAYDVYHASPEVVPDLVSEEPPPTVSRTSTRKESVVRVQEEPTAAYSPSPPPTSPATLSRRATTRGPTRQPTLAKEARPDASATVGTIEVPPSESPKLERQKTRVSTEMNDRLPQVLTVPSIPIERERKLSTAAPGIAAPPLQMVQRDRKPTEVEKKPRRKVPNYPPERQYPPAPAYPVRETPAWTIPDTHTPPPQPKVEPVPKKRGIFGLGSKPKEEPKPVQQSAPEPRYRQPEPHRDRPVEPFRYAAPGPVPGLPGGTLQRPRGYPTAPGHEPIRRAPAPIPVRRDDHYPRTAPVYARKDDYYPRLAPVVQDRRNDYPPAQHTPVRRDIFPPPQAAPIRRDVRAQPYYPSAPARRDYPSKYQGQPRARPNIPYRDEARQQPLRGQASEPVRRQPPAKQDLRDQEKAPLRSQAPAPQRRPQTHEEPVRARPVPQEEAVSRPVRRDARSNYEARNPSLPQEQPPEPWNQPTKGNGGQDSPASEAEASDEEADGDSNSELSSQDQRDTPGRHSIDGVSSPNVRPGVSRNHAGVTSDPDRRTSAQAPNGSRPSTLGPREAAPIARAPVRPGAGRRASEAAATLQTARTASTIGSRRPSTALGRSRTQRRSSVAGQDAGTGIPTRTATSTARIPTIPTEPGGTIRRASTTAGAPVSRATDTGATGPGEAVPPAGAREPSTAEFGVGNSTQASQTAASGTKPARTTTGLPRRRSSIQLYDTSSSDPYAVPQRAAPAKPSPEPSRTDSIPASHSPTGGWFRGKGKEQAAQRPSAEAAEGGAGRDPSPAKDKGSGAGAGEQPKGQLHEQQPGKVGAKAVQGSSGLRGRWGWGWGR